MRVQIYGIEGPFSAPSLFIPIIIVLGDTLIECFSVSTCYAPSPGMVHGWLDPNDDGTGGDDSGTGGDGGGAGGDGGTPPWSPDSPDNPSDSGSGMGGAAQAAAGVASIGGFAGAYGAAEKLASPIVLDLDGDGIETSSMEEGVFFDLNANAFSEITGWVKSNDGLLVLDRNGNGVVDDGRELFGDYTILEDGKTAPNGFNALAELDDNTDGKIDLDDAAYTQLKVWRDINQDGVSDATELFSLAELGIKSLNVNYENVDITDPQGNVKKQQSTFERIDGTIQEMSDYYFRTNQTFTIPRENILIPEDIALLPEIIGSGSLYSLHQTMARDTTGELKSLVEAFINESDSSNRTAIVEQILLKWTNSENIDPASMGEYVDARHLNVVEAFMGEEYLGIHGYIVYGSDAGSALSRIYQGLQELIYSQLMSQTHFKDLYDKIVFKWYEDRQSLEGNLGDVRTELESRFQANPEQGKADIADFFRTLRGSNLASLMQDYWYTRNILAGLDPELGWLIDSAGKKIVASTSGDDTISGTYIDTAVAGGDGNDTITGQWFPDKATDDVFYGNSGNDTLKGYKGNDILDGGTGDDLLEGGQGHDLYHYGLGYGNDTIISYDPEDNGFDIVQLGSGLSADSFEYLQTGEDLILRIKSTGETLTAKDWFKGENYQFDILRFANNTNLAAANLSDRAAVKGDDGDNSLHGSHYHNDTIYGFAGNDELAGYEGNDQLFGGDGDDLLYGGSGNDVLEGGLGNDIIYADSGDDLLSGGEGNDTLYGWDGNDTLDGGSGNDLLRGGPGDDTYLYGLGEGNDSIDNNFGLSDGFDTIRIKDNCSPEDIAILQNGEHLVISIKSSGETLTVQNWFMGGNYQVDQLTFSDGTTLNAAELTNLAVVRGSEGNDGFLIGSAYHDDTMFGLGGNDSIYGYAGNDILYGEGGNDTLYGGSGNDVLDGGAGDDLLRGGSGDDTYIYGIGSGNDIIDSSYGGMPNGFDTVQMGSELTLSDVEFIQNGESISVRIKSTGEALTATDWFSGESNQFDQLRFGDGTVLTAADISNLVIVKGTESNDTIHGSSNHDDTMYGLAGNDIVYGKEGNDQLYGGEGDDTLHADTGNDRLYGQEGNDTLYGCEGDDYLDGGAGNDSLSGGTGNDIYSFGLGSGHDRINNSESDWASAVDVIQIGDGLTVDSIEFTLSNNLIDKNDLIIRIKSSGETLTVTNWFYSDDYQVDKIRFSDGTELTAAEINSLTTIRGTDNAETLTGSDKDDRIYGLGGNDTLNGGKGNDILDGGAGNDTLSGGEGDDVYLYGIGSGNDTINSVQIGASNGFDTVQMGPGLTIADIDIVQRLENLMVVIKSTGETLTATSWFMGENYQFDQIRWKDGSVLTAAQISDLAVVKGTESSDTLYASSYHDDKIYGFAGNDSLYGYAGNDQLFGGDGNDTLDGGAGADIMDGGNGNDLYYVDNPGDIIIEQADGGTDTVRSYISYVLGENLENLTLYGTLSISGTGNELNNYMTGNSGDNIIDGGIGADTMAGGAGNDTYIVDNIGDIVSESASSGTDTVRSSIAYTLGSNVENLVLTGSAHISGAGNSLNNSLTGNSGNNSLDGGAGNDILDGGAGDDILRGGLGNDTYIFGIGYGFDTINNYEGASDNGLDTLQFQNLASAAIEFTANGNDLVCTITQAGETIRVTNWTLGISYQVETFQFTDGSFTAEDVNQRIA